MNFVRQALLSAGQIQHKNKLSELAAASFNSSKAFGGGNWRKN
jgi:hypothetical protein